VGYRRKPTATLNEESVFNEPTANVESVVGEGSVVNEATVNVENVVGDSYAVNEDSGNEANVQAETIRGEGTGTAKKGKKKKGEFGKRRGRGRPEKKTTTEPVSEDDIIEHLRRSVNNEGEVGQSSVVGDKGLSDVEEYNSELDSGSDSDEDGVENPQIPNFQDAKWNERV